MVQICIHFCSSATRVVPTFVVVPGHQSWLLDVEARLHDSSRLMTHSPEGIAVFHSRHRIEVNGVRVRRLRVRVGTGSVGHRVEIQEVSPDGLLGRWRQWLLVLLPVGALGRIGHSSRFLIAELNILQKAILVVLDGVHALVGCEIAIIT